METITIILSFLTLILGVTAIICYRKWVKQREVSQTMIRRGDFFQKTSQEAADEEMRWRSKWYRLQESKSSYDLKWFLQDVKAENKIHITQSLCGDISSYLVSTNTVERLLKAQENDVEIPQVSK